MRLYEMMFLVDPGRAAREWETVDGEISALLERHGAEIRQKHRFDERKLSYPIAGLRRGTYLLLYLEMDPDGVEELRNDLNLSEVVVRSLILTPKGGVIPDDVRLGTMEPMSAEQIARAKEERPEEREEPRPEPDAGEGEDDSEKEDPLAVEAEEEELDEESDEEGRE